jgi:hypothetical protein
MDDEYQEQVIEATIQQKIADLIVKLQNSAISGDAGVFLESFEEFRKEMAEFGLQLEETSDLAGVLTELNTDVFNEIIEDVMYGNGDEIVTDASGGDRFEMLEYLQKLEARNGINISEDVGYSMDETILYYGNFFD